MVGPNLVVQGAFVALIGVISTLLVTALTTIFTTILQLRHARKENELARKLKLKKDVYLSFVSEQTRRINAFAKLSDPRIPLEEITSIFQRGSEAGARLHVIAKPSTIAQLTKHGELVGTNFFDLLPAAAELRRIQNNVGLANQTVQSALQEQAKIVELMKQQNLSGHPNPSQFTVLQQWNQRAQESFKSASAERDKNTSRILELQTQFITECNRAVFVVDESLKKLIAKLRSEINDNDIIEEEYLRAASVDYKKIEATASRALEEVKQKFNGDENNKPA